MSRNPLVSVIIPAFNYGSFIEEAITSLQEQTFANWECIIVDDGSTDDTAAKAISMSKSDPRITYEYQENKGLPGARNTGLKKANGDFVQFLDADDLMAPSKLEVQLQIFQNNKAIDIVYGDVFLFKNGEDHKTKSISFELKTSTVTGFGEKVIAELIEDNIFLVHSALCKKTAINVLFNENLKALEDWNFWFKCALSNRNFHYHQGLEGAVYVRSHGENMSMSRKRMWLNKAAARKDIMQYAESMRKLHLSSDFVQKMNKKHKTLLHLDMLRYHLMFGSITKGLAHLIQFCFYSKKVAFGLYDGGYWIKERIKVNIS